MICCGGTSDNVVYREGCLECGCAGLILDDELDEV